MHEKFVLRQWKFLFNIYKTRLQNCHSCVFFLIPSISNREITDSRRRAKILSAQTQMPLRQLKP